MTIKPSNSGAGNRKVVQVLAVETTASGRTNRFMARGPLRLPIKTTFTVRTLHLHGLVRPRLACERCATSLVLPNDRRVAGYTIAGTRALCINSARMPLVRDHAVRTHLINRCLPPKKRQQCRTGRSARRDFILNESIEKDGAALTPVFPHEPHPVLVKQRKTHAGPTGLFVIRPSINWRAAMTKTSASGEVGLAAEPSPLVTSTAQLPGRNGVSLKGHRLQDCPYHSFRWNRVNSSL
jgi:hypothetical protein